MISWEYPPQFSGGLGVHCQAIVRELTSIGVEIELYLPVFKQLEFEALKNLKFHQLSLSHPIQGDSYIGSDIWDSVMEFRDRLEEGFQPEGIDILHAHDWMGVFAATGIAKKYKIPLIWTVHSTENDRAAGKPLNPGIFSIEQEAFSNVKHTIAVSQRTKQYLIHSYQADPNCISAIYNGIDVSTFEQLATRDYQNTDGYILFLGRLTGQKAPDVFLQAAKLVLSERDDVRFLIAGDGDLLHKLRLQSRRMKIHNRVEFAGNVLGEKLLECYKNALLFVLPARSEPFGITVLEAMASGIPTIISSTTGAGEIVENVYVVEPNQPKELAMAIIKLLDDPELRKKLGQKGAKEAQACTWKKVAFETQQLYLKLLSTSE